MTRQKTAMDIRLMKPWVVFMDAKCRILYTMQSGQIKYKESAIYENNRQ